MADNFKIDVNSDGVALVTMDFQGMKVSVSTCGLWARPVGRACKMTGECTSR